MGYNPVIKNLPFLINDLQKALDGKMSIADLKNKIDYNDYEFDSSDGFEDILDSIRPFIKSITKSSDTMSDTAIRSKLNELITLLKAERSLKELEKVKI